MARIFGLDFGMTNSLAGFVERDRMVLLTNRDDGRPHPSVVWYSGGDVVVGRRAKRQLEHLGTGIIGDAVRSPKAALGTGASLHVAGVAREPGDVVKEIFRFIREDAMQRRFEGMAFDQAIVTIPVNMNGRARRELREAALKAGLHIVQFVHEPLAALYGYLRSQPDFRRRVAELEGQIALVFDWGGGTLDLTLCKFVGGVLVQILNRGDDNVGGDRFDERLIRYVKDQHVRIHGLTAWPDELPNANARLIEACENAKIELSKQATATVFVPNFLRVDGPARDLHVVLSRDTLIEQTHDLVSDGMKNVDTLLKAAGFKEASVALCLATGGMIEMPYIRERLIERFGIVRAPKIANGSTVIAEGAAWIANDGLRLRLAKPFEVLHADDSHVCLIHEKTALPTENRRISFPFGMYCVDPRDGYAKFQFCRPRWPGRTLSSDPRKIYTNLTIGVDGTAAPLFERLELRVEIDHDLIAHVRAKSSLRGDERSTEIHDLEFGLALSNDETDPDEVEERAASAPGNGRQNRGQAGEVRLRSNVARDADSWALVPGEIVGKFHAGYFDVRNNPPARQREELHYYSPCAVCGRYSDDINMNGCDPCAQHGRAPSVEQAAANRLRLDRLIREIADGGEPEAA